VSDRLSLGSGRVTIEPGKAPALDAGSLIDDMTVERLLL
jgi:hypothetical protein